MILNTFNLLALFFFYFHDLICTITLLYFFTAEKLKCSFILYCIVFLFVNMSFTMFNLTFSWWEKDLWNFHAHLLYLTTLK